MNLLGQLLFNLLLPGYGWLAAGFPRCAGLTFVTTAFFWIFAWPFAIPYHLMMFAIGVDVMRKHEAQNKS